MTTDFLTETVDGDGEVLGQTSLVVDGNGNPAVAYVVNRPVGNVRVARRLNGTWTSEDTGGQTTQGVSLVSLGIDAQDVPHIAYRDRSSDSAIFASRGPGGWSFEEIPTQAGLEVRGTTEVSMRLDSDGVPSVAFRDDFTGERMAVATRDGTSSPWEVATLEKIGETGFVKLPSLAFDLSETPRVAFIDEFNEGQVEINEQAIRLSQKSVDGWQEVSEILDKTVRQVRWLSLAQRTSAKYVIAYCEAAHGNLSALLSTFDSTGPLTEIVAPGIVIAGNSNPRPSAAVDLLSRPSIAYVDDGELKLATRSAPGSWTIQPIGPAVDWPSLAYDSTGNAHIAYSTGNLMYTKVTNQ
ncbi:hypothetical protein [Streptomyces palmae]|uniref:Uncharacterized protein n=1 Tax=Streptomyces palmae TaxID=1701085 RepID=A0A4Z0H530_9ACTN|nr:hypothetical protein [Streptomyces palmae]TGB05552.1 hypothetical protein E4099_19310 [Streptomyces palmae]